MMFTFEYFLNNILNLFNEIRLWDNLFFLLPEIQIILIVCTLLISYAFIIHNKQYPTLLRYVNDISLFSLFWIYLNLNTQYLSNGNSYYIFDGSFEVSLSTILIKKIIIIITFFILYISKDFLKKQKALFFEYYILFLSLTLGTFISISANDFLLLYLGLEMQSLAAITLACFDGKNMGNEAGLKYFLVGCFSSVLLLYGFSLVSSSFGTQNLNKIALHSLFLINDYNYNAIIGIFFILISFFIKLGVAPFHLWIADVYEGALLPVVIYFATVQKLVTFLIFAKLFKKIFISFEFLTQPFLIIVSICSMIFGAMLASYATLLKRFLAFSSISHMGFILLAFSFSGKEGFQVSILYFILYLSTTISAWFSIMYISFILDNESNILNIKTLNDLKLFSQSEPFLGIIVLTNLFSMAGIPPLTGFLAKSYLLTSLINEIISLKINSLLFINNNHLTFLYLLSCFISIYISILAGFYYLRLVKEFYNEKNNKINIKNPNIIYKYILILTFFINIFGFLFYDLVTSFSIEFTLLNFK